jgi:regulator of sigma E protease
LHGATEQRSVGPVEALRGAVQSTADVVVEVLRGFGMLFTGKVGLESLGGPITIAKMSGQAADIGASVFVHLMALISVNLAVINLLPVPVLDGGHIMIFTIEAITRRKMSLETRMKITKVGIALVGLLMIIAIGNDVLGLF